jgi:hypothetical protein
LSFIEPRTCGSGKRHVESNAGTDLMEFTTGYRRFITFAGNET